MTAMIPCRLAKGIFDTELYVHVAGASAAVDRSALEITQEPQEKQEGSGFVSVFLVESRGDRELVELPGELVFGSLRTWVSASDLRGMTARG